MSGGHFDYDKYAARNIAEEVDSLMRNNRYGYSDETLSEFQDAINVLKKATVYAQRIDYLVSDDDDEETFHRRLKQELETLELSECVTRGLKR